AKHDVPPAGENARRRGASLMPPTSTSFGLPQQRSAVITGTGSLPFEVPVPVMKRSLRPVQECALALRQRTLDVDRRLQGDRCRRALCRGWAGAETTPARVPGQKIHLLNNPAHWPSPVHVAWHRRNRFKG